MDKATLRRQVDGVVRNVLHAHPEYITEAGKKWLSTSITKRLTGQLQSLLLVSECPKGHTGGGELDSPSVIPAGARLPRQEPPTDTEQVAKMDTHDDKITPDEHSDIVGGSTAGRVLACPGSVQLNKAVKHAHMTRIAKDLATTDEFSVVNPDLVTADNLSACPAEFIKAVEARYRAETTSSYADEGTALHEAIAWLLQNEDEEPTAIVDRKFEGHYITDSLYESAIVPALDGFDDYCEQVFREDGEEMVFVIEKRCQLPGVPGAFGTSDIIGKTRKRIVIWDWKFGAGVPVSPVNNSQLKFYGRSALYTMSDWFDFPVDDKGMPPADTRVDLVIAQPRIGDGTPQVWTTTVGELEKFRWQLVSAVTEAVGKDPKVSRGDHCKWCDAKHICPAKQQLGQRILSRIDEAAEDVAEVKGDEAYDFTAAVIMKAAEVQFTPDDLADWLKDADDIEDWVKWVRSLALSELSAGRAVTGKELDQGLGNAAWTVDEKTVDRRLASYGLSVEERRNVSPISPTQARKLVKKTGDDKNAKLLEKIIERPKGALRMVDAGTAKNPVASTSDKVAALGDKLKNRSEDNA